MRALHFGIGLAFAALAHGQLDLPTRVVMDGAAAGDRQVVGLADPAAPHAGVSVDAARGNSATYSAATGTAVLSISLSPAPAALPAGMSVVIVPQEANAAGALLSVNGLAPVPVLKPGGLPLDSADLTPGAPHRLVFDGTAFRLISHAYLPCPAGFHAAAREYCIEDSARAPLTFYAAVNACAAIGARLCTFAEWWHACRTNVGFIGTVSNWEWVDSAANDNSTAKVVGYGGDGASAPPAFGCNRGYHQPPGSTAFYRCCYTR